MQHNCFIKIAINMNVNMLLLNINYLVKDFEWNSPLKDY